ncbi:MAG: GNAT family N-acetyltransferase [Solirubrobacteraceae bacterium]|jgi:CelD/BcsL family acetyltransferase involved in cellulose biosynthesis
MAMTSAADAGTTSRGPARSDGQVGHRVLEVGDLKPGIVDRWLELRASNPALDSPYFHPEFTAAVAATDPGVRIIVADDSSGAISSFLPVQLDRRTCRPAGFPAADFQGPICEPGRDYDIAAAIGATGASSYSFDHMRDGLAGFEPWIFGRQDSPYMEVAGGIDGYLSRASRSGKDKVAEARRLSRKAERDHGPVRLVVESSDAAVLETVIDLKRRQYRSTGARDYFADPRHIGLLRRLFATRDASFGGMLSAVYVGPDLLAAHFGLRAGPVLHWWFPVYNPEFSRLSPGWVLLRAMIDAAPELGLERIDLGRGLDDYKRRAMTGHQIVCQGELSRSPLRHRTVAARRSMVAAVRSSRIAPALRGAARYTRRRSG